MEPATASWHRAALYRFERGHICTARSFLGVVRPAHGRRGIGSVGCSVLAAAAAASCQPPSTFELSPRFRHASGFSAIFGDSRYQLIGAIRVDIDHEAEEVAENASRKMQAAGLARPYISAVLVVVGEACLFLSVTLTLYAVVLSAGFRQTPAAPGCLAVPG